MVENRKIIINKSILAKDNEIANSIRQQLEEKKIISINILGSPGSGKTTFIESIASDLQPHDLFVIQGDLESDIDKKRLEEKNIDAYQINTHSGCHLNAHMIQKALDSISLLKKKYLLIENVGNLVCPSGKNIGQHMNIVISSVTEGEDKVQKYPYIFMDAHLIVMSKYDLKAAVEFREEQYLNELKRINPKGLIIRTNKKNGAGFSDAAGKLIEFRKNFYA